MSKSELIPWAKPDYWGNEYRYVNEALKSTWISGGSFVERIEKSFCELSQAKHALAVANGTAAIQLAYLALGIGSGDEVVLPGFGFLAAANVALNMAARPVFCEVDPRTWCMRAEDIEQRLTANTKAIVVVHTYGNVCDMGPILELANHRGIPVIEDAAEAFPSRYCRHLAGTMGKIGTYSFQATKTITGGEGGMVVTHDDTLRDRMELYRSHGLRRKKHYLHELPGLNFRLTNMQAALCCAQLEQLDRIVAERHRVYKTYQRRLKKIPGITLQNFGENVAPVVWAVAFKLDPLAFPQGRDSIIEQMFSNGIELRPGFYSPAQIEYFDCSPLPVCDSLASSIISLPSFPTLTDTQIHFICDNLINLSHS